MAAWTNGTGTLRKAPSRPSIGPAISEDDDALDGREGRGSTWDETKDAKCGGWKGRFCGAAAGKTADGRRERVVAGVVSKVVEVFAAEDSLQVSSEFQIQTSQSRAVTRCGRRPMMCRRCHQARV